MGAYEPLRNYLSDGAPQHMTSPAIKYLSGLLCGAVGAGLCNPCDIVKTREQSLTLDTLSRHIKKSNPHRHLATVRDIYSEHGLLGFYKGWSVTACRSGCLNSAQLGSYDTIKNNLLIGKLGMKDGFWLHLCSSMTAGVVTTTAANPFDVVKTRFMSDTKRRYRSPLDCALKTLHSEGLSCFLKGWVPAYLRLGPHTVLSLLLIEQVRMVLGLNTL